MEKSASHFSVLSLNSRRDIYELIASQPGVCIREMERILGIRVGNLSYHLSILLDAGLIQEDKDKYFRRFYLESIDKKERVIMSLLRREAVRKIIPFFLSEKSVTISRLSKAVNISKSTAHWHIQRFRKINLLKKRKVGNRIYYSLSDEKAVRRIYHL